MREAIVKVLVGAGMALSVMVPAKADFFGVSVPRYYPAPHYQPVPYPPPVYHVQPYSVVPAPAPVIIEQRRASGGSICVTPQGECGVGRAVPLGTGCRCVIPGFGRPRGRVEY